MSQRDKLKERLEILQKENDRLQTVLSALQEETENLPPADSIQELETHLEIPKKQINLLIAQVGETRNAIQELETALHQHQLQAIQEYQAIKTATVEEPCFHSLNACPNCGYVFDEEIFNIVRTNYSTLNEDYMCQQIQLIIDSVMHKLNAAKERYVSLMERLREEETVFSSEKDEFDIYVQQRGLQNSVRRFTDELNKIRAENAGVTCEIKQISKEIKQLPDKKDVEEKYMEFVRLNIMTLGAWDSTYDGNIKLLRPVKAQGTLENKIILAQSIGLFQTMDYFKSGATRFPFVVDSPRAKEASFSSSKDILKMIAQLEILPQIILATMDYKDFQIDIKTPATIITLTKQRKLLCDSDYTDNQADITSLVELLKNI